MTPKSSLLAQRQAIELLIRYANGGVKPSRSVLDLAIKQARDGVNTLVRTERHLDRLKAANNSVMLGQEYGA